jgi:O-antigen/teichoic acid export membrane protein
MAITFIMAPIYVKMLGQYDYGLREMVMAMVGYMGMLSLGMRPTISRFASMYNAQKDRDALFIVYASSLAFMFLVGLLLAAFFWVWAASYPELIIPEEGGGETKYTLFLLIVGANLLFAFPKYVAESYLEGLQRYYLKNNVNIIGSILLATIAYIYITPENGLLLLVGLVAISVLIKLFIFGGLLLRPAYGAIYPNLRFFSWDKLKEMLRFGFKSFIQGAASKIETVSDRLVIGGILGPAMVPLYSIPANLVNYLMGISQTLTHAFMPLFSDLSARGQTNKIRSIYMLASKLVVGFVVPAGVGAVVVGAPFIDVWMSGEFAQQQVDGIVFMLVLYVVIPKLNPFASRYLTAIGEHAIFAKVAPVAALANLGLSIWLVIEYGVIGAAMGSVLPVFVVTPIFLKYSCRALGVSSREYVSRSILPTLLPTMVMGAATFWIRDQWGLDNYSEILGCIGIGAVIYTVLFWLVSFKPDEREFLLNLVKTKLR